jgi:hypothetical protein
MHEKIQAAILDFTKGADQADDLTLVIMEYRGQSVSNTQAN